MKDKLKSEMKEAMKAKDKIRLATIRELLSAIQYEEMQKNTDALPEQALIAIFLSEAKKRKESLEFAEKDGRADLIESLHQEISVIEEFLPAQLSAEELEKIIVSFKEQDPGTNMGSVMKALREEYAGRYDGKAASEVAKRVLG